MTAAAAAVCVGGSVTGLGDSDGRGAAGAVVAVFVGENCSAARAAPAAAAPVSGDGMVVGGAAVPVPDATATEAAPYGGGDAFGSNAPFTEPRGGRTAVGAA